MKKLEDVLRDKSTNQTLLRRRKMALLIEQAIDESPEDVDKLLAVIGEIYNDGNISRLWDLLATLTGNDRGWGNDYFFSALEIRERKKNEPK